jgi:7-carboxy-7-deazaguanine synthase
MLAGRPHLEPHLRPELHSLRVNEIYLSIQGESSQAGRLCTFVRLTGCHLRCSYCDSAHAFLEGRRLDVEAVLARVRELAAPLVEITGGEPLLQPAVYPLMQRLLDEGREVMLETSGAIDVRLVPAAVRKIVDLKTPSSGEVDRNDWRVLDSMGTRDELKFVLGDATDYAWAKKVLSERRISQKPFGVLFSPVFGRLQPVQLAEWIIADRLPVRFQLQMHKQVWPPDARGV